VAVCSLLLAALGCFGEDGGGHGFEPPKAAYVELATVEPELLVYDAALTGQFDAEFSIVLRPEIEGVVASIGFEEGARVEEGQLLFTLRNGEQRARVDLAEAERKLAVDVYQRTKQLSKSAISAVSQVAEAAAELDKAKAQVALAKVEFERTLIRAPFAGIAGLRFTSVGDRVSEGDPLVSLDAIDRLQLVFTTQSIGFGLGQVGDPIFARVYTYPDERFSGEVFFISPTVDPATRRMILKAWVPNVDHRLKPGMFANVDVQVARHESALVVPESALVYDRNGTYLWRVGEESKAEKIPVEIGLRPKGRVEIVQGLAPGDTVVAVGTHKVRAGMSVIDVNADAEAHAGGGEEPASATKGRGEEG
jgi:membrane fusion protein (multidrug efflux system)